MLSLLLVAHYCDRDPDPIAMADEVRKIRKERGEIQVALDEAMARDEQSEEELGLIKSALRETSCGK
jgi:hypothetical protein